MQCPVCKNDRATFAFKLERPPGKLWDIYECDACITQFIYPIPSLQESKEEHDEYYETDEARRDLNNPHYGRLTFRRQWGIIRKLVNINHGRILDFGCGGGHFLSSIGDGWEKYGIEISPKAGAVANQKGIKTFTTLDEAAFPPEFFDIIVMFAVIEHLPNPREVVEKIKSTLKSGGIFVIMTGDRKSLQARIQGEKWAMYTPPGHAFFFAAESIDCLMDSLGFEKVKALWAYGGTGHIGFLPLVITLWAMLFPCSMLPIIRSHPLFSTYYGYYQKRKEINC